MGPLFSSCSKRWLDVARLGLPATGGLPPAFCHLHPRDKDPTHERYPGKKAASGQGFRPTKLAVWEVSAAVPGRLAHPEAGSASSQLCRLCLFSSSLACTFLLNPLHPHLPPIPCPPSLASIQAKPCLPSSPEGRSWCQPGDTWESAFLGKNPAITAFTVPVLRGGAPPRYFSNRHLPETARIIYAAPL